MKRAGKLGFVLVLILSTTTGCWNLREPNQFAFLLGSGIDLTKDEKLELSTLIAKPKEISGGDQQGAGGAKKSFIVVSATGKNHSDATQNLQEQLSRSLFPGHRDIILIGQRMAESGISDMIDSFFRNPETEMRSRAFVIKEGEAKDVLSIESYFDPFITSTLLSQIKNLGLKKDYFRSFVSDALGQGTQPTLPAIQLNASHHYTYSGTAIFNKDNDLKMVGFLDAEESFYANWVKGRQTSFVITTTIPEGNGKVSLKLDSLGQRIHIKMVDKKIQIDVHLSGNGSIIENDTNLDPSNPKDFHTIQNELDQRIQKSIQQIIKKVQKEYKTDIFGFGERVHQKYPYQWKTLKHNWNETFPQLQVSVNLDLQFDSGLGNSSIKDKN